MEVAKGKVVVLEFEMEVVIKDLALEKWVQSTSTSCSSMHMCWNVVFFAYEKVSCQ
jgi:hypothetical protein